MSMIPLTEEMMTYALLGLAAAVVVLFVLCIILFVKLGKQKKRYDYFMGTGKRPSMNLEQKLDAYFESSRQIEEKYTKLLNMVTDIDQTFKTQIQKVGLVRYNQFAEMGGNLCFALALLDAEDNGVVLNGIHSRTGSFTYAKPIEMGVSIYMLSEEEMQAVELAQKKAYQPKHEKVVKVRFKPIFRKKHAGVAENQISLEELERATEAKKAQNEETIEAKHRQKMASIGDVTQEERKLILQEETLAGKIAAAEAILKRREEKKAAEQNMEVLAFTEAIIEPIHSEVLTEATIQEEMSKPSVRGHRFAEPDAETETETEAESDSVQKEPVAAAGTAEKNAEENKTEEP